MRVYSTDELDYEVYLHRIGRSGRFSCKGAAFNCLVTTQDEENMTKIERHFRRYATQDEENMTKIERHFQRYATQVCWDNEGDFENA